MHPYSKNYERRKLENKFISTNWKKMKQLFFSSIYIWFHFHKVENISPMTFFFQSGKNWNDFLYMFIFLFLFTGTGKYSTYWKWFILLPKILERQMQNVFIYFHEVEKQTSFPYFYTHLILFLKMENIVPTHFLHKIQISWLSFLISILYIILKRWVWVVELRRKKVIIYET